MFAKGRENLMSLYLRLDMGSNMPNCPHVEKRFRKFLRNGTIRAFTLKCLNALNARNRSKPITVKENSVTPFRRQNNLAK